MLVEKPEPLAQGRFLLIGFVAAVVCLPLPAQEPIGRTTATEVQVSGAVDISHGETLLGNGSQVTAGDQAVSISLQRGGSLHLCSTSSVYLAKDGSVDNRVSSALMMALGRGAIEANYVVGKYSDVLLTPDLRILVSGPGQANLSIRVNTKGDTCVDNHGADAPYVTVSSQLEGGAYRVLPDQRVSFQHGSLHEVVDHEPEPCGCPVVPVTSLASTGSTAGKPASPGRPVGGPSSTAADTAFPIAESEGLAAPPAAPAAPVVPPGQAHAQVTVPLTYNGENPAAGPAVAAAPVAAAPAAAAPAAGATPSLAAAPPPPAAPEVAPVASSTPAPAQPEVAAAPVNSSTNQSPSQGGGIFHRIGHFFSKLFGK
jgi:hypothetical protein